MLRLSLQWVIWWWHLVFKVECVPQLTTKLGWLVKIKSIHELKVDSMCVGSDISWSKLCNDVRASKYVLSVVVLSSFHQDENLALKSPKIKKLDATVLLQSYSRSTINWYGAMFTCMASSAVNIEVTCSLDTGAFILVLWRLVTLVAWKKHIYGDGWQENSTFPARTRWWLD